MSLNNQNQTGFFSRALLRWYRRHGRDLPWRRTSDPYAIWISEIMLQQTQVETVLPYYHRFLSAFPMVYDLAAAPMDRVLKMWEGLGYYARARHLHEAAKVIVAQFGGKLPSSFEEMLSLPGIGKSTAGAILTIAFGQRHPILDGNVRRVLCRYFSIEQDPKSKEVEQDLWHHSEGLLPNRKADLYTQAIMDLGATICLPAAPKCPECPVSEGCRGLQNGLQDRLPLRVSRKKIPHYDHLAGVLLHEEKILIRRRPLNGLLAGLWEFPGGRVERDRSDPYPLQLEEMLAKETYHEVKISSGWLRVKHVFTHFRMTLHVFTGRVKKLPPHPPAELKWIDPDDLREYPFSSAHQKIVSKLLGIGAGDQRSLF